MLYISIHAPREGGDANTDKKERLISDISIHAPREGGDFQLISAYPIPEYFNPRPPRGGRR